MRAFLLGSLIGVITGLIAGLTVGGATLDEWRQDIVAQCQLQGIVPDKCYLIVYKP